MDWIATILAILTALFGGCNIIQLVNNRQLRRKLEADADQEHNKSLLQIINGQSEEIARLNKAYGDLQQKYFVMAEEMQSMRMEMAGMKARENKKTKK